MSYNQPDINGFYGKFGGQFVPETLMTAVIELDKAYREAKADPSFQAELDELLKNYVGRETPLYYAERLTKHIGGAKIYLKREDLNHTGAHKINNALGQVLLAKRMGKRKSLPKLELVNTVWQQLQQLHFLTWNVLFTWVKKMSDVKPSMFFVWSCSVLKYTLSQMVHVF